MCELGLGWLLVCGAVILDKSRLGMRRAGRVNRRDWRADVQYQGWSSGSSLPCIMAFEMDWRLETVTPTWSLLWRMLTARMKILMDFSGEKTCRHGK